MITSKKSRFQYAILTIEDLEGGDVPDYINGKLISSTESCIMVGCTPDTDGPTHIILGWEDEVAQNEKPAFRGVLTTNLKTITIRTAEGDIVLKKKVPNTKTRIAIWVNHPEVPNEIRIGIARE